MPDDPPLATGVVADASPSLSFGGVLTMAASINPKLTYGADHKLWSRKLKSVLTVAGVANAIEKRRTRGTPVDAKADALAHLAILYACEEHIGALIQDMNASEAWEKLEQLLADHDAANLLGLWDMLVDTHMTREEGAVQYINRVVKLAQRLEAADQKVNDGLLITIVLKGLPREYGSVQNTVRAMQSKGEMSLEQLTMMLTRTEADLKPSKNGVGEAFYTGGEAFYT
mmetsp:Transcript_11653/g.34475  ORF Transcript_11653/g.34475 Transcript_11653/m.34475 type:complete len:228 (-) Transcript_11653:729-1412(-)